MKVVCDSCQAKYQVPDERVAGKKLKIRCKRCGATVLIRGDLLGALNGTDGADGGSDGMGGESVVGSELSQTLSGAVAPDMLDMSGAERTSVPPEAISLGELARATQHGLRGELGDEDYEWHVSLDGDTQGPFGTAALTDWLYSTP